MSLYPREAGRLTAAEHLVGKLYPRFGPNKRRETVRLLYEISLREGISPEAVLPPELPAAFPALKDYLLRRRYPLTSAAGLPIRPYLPRLELKGGEVFTRPPLGFSPKKIYIESAAASSSLAAACRERFPQVAREEIPGLKEFIAFRPGRGVADYNRRGETLFIIAEQYDFFKSCPCTKGAVCCGYQVCNLGFGCLFECRYCFLPGYVNTPGIILPANIDRFFKRFSEFTPRSAIRPIRLGTGEFTDSLHLDDLTGYSLPLVEFFRDRRDVLFEFKTKSDKIDNLLRVDPRGNIVAAWSLNPERMVSENEHYTATLDRRLAAAGRAAAAGYRIAFHFDPIFFFPGWEKEYGETVERMFAAVEPAWIAWISLGTLRFPPALKKVIENRFPGSSILDAELLPGFDGKLRYPPFIRTRIYRFMIDRILARRRDLPLYLCMESREIWEGLQLPFPF
jgi:spore photoproduct lyase